tara:strand:- start:985 stop:2214 length:1230 start_codon:yes stop_codon:yes gene_type:complete
MKIPNFSKKCKKLGLKLDQIKSIENLLKKNGGKLFLVGGNVRDIILEKKMSSNPDIVANLPIEKVIEFLEKKKILISKIGLKFSSIVIRYKGISIDLTSMRKDLNTDGRWADTLYTNEILEDAKRRDFTINAIYCDTSGKIYDPFNGVKDLKKSRVKFIDSPEERINQDFLRILRFLRFSYKFSDELDEEGALACKKLIKNIRKLSFERRIQELEKILLLKNVGNKKIIKNLAPYIENSIGSKICIERFDYLCDLEKSLKNSSFERRFKFLIRKSRKKNLEILKKMKNKTKDRILKKINLPKENKKEMNLFFYNYPKDLIVDQLIEDYSDRKISKNKFLKLMDFNKFFKKIELPINGNDLIKIGFKKGKKVGEVLEKVKNWWIYNDFRPKKEECKSFARKNLPTRGWRK